MVENEKKVVKLVDAPISDHRIVFEGSEKPVRISDAAVSEPRDTIKSMLISDIQYIKKDKKSK